MSIFLSTTEISESHGLIAYPFVFNFLIREGYLTDGSRRYELTDKGREYGYLYKNGHLPQILWEQDKLSPILEGFRNSLCVSSSMNPSEYMMPYDPSSLRALREDNLPDLSADYGLLVSAELHEFFYEAGYIYYDDEYDDVDADSYILGSKGEHRCSILIGDDVIRYHWREEDTAEALQALKLQLLRKSNKNFKLYHMTHIDNLSNIMNEGLFPHNLINEYHDISNSSVNQKRQMKEPVFNRSIHDYVPFYFNVRNAMLYAVQSKHQRKIIILELDPNICLRKNVLFTFKNAACNNSVFYQFVQEFISDNRWPQINASTWNNDIDTKQNMMSECLVPGRIDSDYIKAIHCIDKEAQEDVLGVISKFENSKVEFVYENRSLFF